VISDEFDFDFPSMERFVDPAGQFSEARFALYAALRPWLWARVARLARNSRHASQVLCDSLGKIALNPVASVRDTGEAVNGR